MSMAPNRLALFSQTLNIDCTLLITLCSDISYGGVEVQGWHTSSVKSQISIESREPLLPHKIWRVLGTHPLVCTRSAFEKLNEVVEVIGTASEKKRASLLFEQGGICKSQQQRIEELQELSTYKIPASWNLPIQVLEAKDDSLKKFIPATVFKKITEDLKDMSPTTRSTLYFGWSEDITTLSSNKEALNKIRHSILKHRGYNYKIVGPDVWTFSPARNLVGDFYVKDRSLVPDSWNRKQKPTGQE
ncbi:hypothetical protein B0O99DRAFT_681577 [Bisporella sp. PMI_857]|nr:hypothetical protein B0O99DRAFT_681577 [Bisporella sp. PMI_857]